MTKIRFSLCVGALGMMLALPVVTDADDSVSLSEVSNFSLQAAPQDDGGAGAGSGDDGDVEGPVSMRSADVQAQGTFDLKIIADYSTSSDGSDDDIGNRFELQWGFMENHELVLKLPVGYGDGRIEGNGDVSVGWQWKFHEGDGSWMPSIALYHEMRLPTGYHSSGHDLEVRGVFTWDVNPGTCRLHLNPFIRFMDTDNLETNMSRELESNGASPSEYKNVSGRHFAAGGIIGIDHRLSDTTVINVDYILDSGRLDGYRMQHMMEAGMDYKLSDSRMLTWATRWTMDGDDQGDNWGLSVGYIFSF